MTDIQVSGVCERDIDLLLLEEFVANPEFYRWFLQQVQIPTGNRLRAAARSVVTSTGESDLELTLDDGDRVTKVLIENKIDACLQPHQAERYAKRGAGYVAGKECDAFTTVLVAPDAYGGGTAGFRRRLSYEAIQECLKNALAGDARAGYKLLLLREAIEKGNTGWTAVPDEAATAFWRRYWELASVLAPQLGMPPPGEKPATSGFIRFPALALAPGVQLIHKVPYGNVDLQFAETAERAAEFEAKYGAYLEHGMQIVGAGKSLVVRMAVPAVQLEAPLGKSEAPVRTSLEAAAVLLKWYARWVKATWPVSK